MTVIQLTSKEEARLNVMDQVVSCTNCDLHAGCLGPVPFTGGTPARIAVLGEAPGEQEDEAGLPFVGPSGQLIRKHLREVGIKEDEVAWLNTASCFPHGTPTRDQIQACSGNRVSQLNIINPDYVLVLGRVALAAQRPEVELKRVRGRMFRDAQHRVNFVTYHPAAALRNANFERSLSEDLEDFAAVLNGKRRWAGLISDKCVMCGQWPEEDHIDEETALNYCFAHAPEHVRMQLKLFHTRMGEQIKAAS